MPSAGLPVDRHTDGLIDVLLDATQNHDVTLTKKKLFGWNAALFPTGYSGLHKIRVGKWRGPEPMQVVSGRIGKEIVHYEAMPSDRVDEEVKHFIQWWHKSIDNMDGIIRAAVAHFWFVTIHPFEDGNGRIARALTDMALAQDGRQSQRYYSCHRRLTLRENHIIRYWADTKRGS